MFDKMDETKRGIVLFHEALKSVAVPHQIVGFWEDTNDATEKSQPNYFNTVIPFQSSLRQDSGPAIMQLEPEEDNRDGYAIRQMTKKMLHRSEAQKFLIVFSDGEPAAFGYEQNGIVDTSEAVIEARKKRNRSDKCFSLQLRNRRIANEDDPGYVRKIQYICPGC
ncbi:activator of nitric oxide reductase [Bacillus subtilis]|nr:activator of nitric oxide reductase [Bacillus subtilis]